MRGPGEGWGGPSSTRKLSAAPGQYKSRPIRVAARVGPGWKVAPDGLRYRDRQAETDTLKGRNGTLVIRAVGSAYQMGIGDSEPWEGAWSIVSGTGDYSGMTGGGRFFGVQP